MIPSDHPLYFDIAAVDTGSTMAIGEAMRALRGIYAALDARLHATTGQLALPCFQSCSDCCHEAVFITPLEFFLVLDHMQREWEPEPFRRAIDEGLRLYAEHRSTIDAFLHGPGPHTALASTLRFTCPLLDEQGCGVYPAREILGRLFGQAFNDEGGCYGCHKSGAFFSALPEVTLVRATAWARELHALPLTHYRQVYPYYFHLLWG